MSSFSPLTATLEHDPLALAPMDRIRKRPGRFDDPDFRYRVHYSANSMAGAYVEALSPLRPNSDAMAAYNAIDGSSDVKPIDEAISEYLEPRSAALLIGPHRDPLVDVCHARSRAFLGERLGLTRLKTGDLTGSSYEISQRASRLFYDRNECGLASISSEAGVEYEFLSFAIFEEAPKAGSLRVQLVPRSLNPALIERIALSEAVYYLSLG